MHGDIVFFFIINHDIINASSLGGLPADQIWWERKL